MDVTSKKLKKKPMKLEDMTKEQIRNAIVKKKECNAKVQQIVESLLEKGITESYLLQCLPDINQAHFDDIIEERSITHLCGYPICKNSISEKDIPKQKYRISVKNNKVYDITARKNFCCNSCYNAAMYVKKQMLTSPLWFREYEIIPEFQILPLHSTGSMGQEIDVSLINRIQIKSEPIFTSINDFAKASLDEMHSDEQNNYSETLVPIMEREDLKKSNLETVNINEHQNKEKIHDPCPKPVIEISPSKESITSTRIHSINSKTADEESSNLEVNKSVEKLVKLSINENKKPAPNPMNIVGEIVEKPQSKVDQDTETPKQSKQKKVLQKKQPVISALTIEVEKCLAEWFTLDTMLFLFGEEKVREMVMDKGECINKYLNNYTKGIFYNANSYDQYQQLCKKLNMLEIEDRLHNTQMMQRETKPLPNYSMLQDESKRMQLKVKAFLAAQTNVGEPDPEQDKSIPEEDSKVTQLPLVDKNAQNALRRRIVCQHLNKVLPDLLRSLGLLTLTVSSDVCLIVNTFKLKANNIMFKPIHWTLIAIVFIKLLSIRDKRLEYFLQQPMAFQHMQLLLLSYKQDEGYLDRLISWLTDIDRLLDTNDSQLSIE